MAAFPNAKIIHVQRNAAATCWSNFKHYFPSRGLGYSFDLRDTAEYYNLYKDLMQFWISIYPNRIFNLDYESLTENQRPQTKALLEYLELNWENQCLYPQKNKRAVRTASHQQVRQKIYRGSSNSWRKFAPYINDAFNVLMT